MPWWTFSDILHLVKASREISAKSNTYGRFWSDVLDAAVQQHYHISIWGYICWENCVHCSSRVPDTGKIQCQGDLKLYQRLEETQNLSKILDVDFPFNNLQRTLLTLITSTDSLICTSNDNIAIKLWIGVREEQRWDLSRFAARPWNTKWLL